jgi:hypothetical protein
LKRKNLALVFVLIFSIVFVLASATDEYAIFSNAKSGFRTDITKSKSDLIGQITIEEFLQESKTEESPEETPPPQNPPEKEDESYPEPQEKSYISSYPDLPASSHVSGSSGGSKNDNQMSDDESPPTYENPIIQGLIETIAPSESIYNYTRTPKKETSNEILFKTDRVSLKEGLDDSIEKSGRSILTFGETKDRENFIVQFYRDPNSTETDMLIEFESLFCIRSSREFNKNRRTSICKSSIRYRAGMENFARSFGSTGR